MAVTYTGTIPEAIMDVYSKEILFQAQPILRFDVFSVKRTELSVTPGLTIKFLKYSNLTAGGILTENVELGTQALAASQIEITVGEYGNAVSVSELLLKASFDDVMASASKLLGFDYAKIIDTVHRDTLLTATNVKYAGQVASRGLVTAGFGSTLVKDGVEVLATGNAPQVGGTNWICFVHPHQGRSMRDDTAWINANQYAGSVAIFAGEIGMYEDTRFIETTQVKKVTGEGGGATPADIYQAILIGAEAYGHAIALPVEMRDNGVEDFGRKHSLAWYSIMGSGLIHDDRVCILESA